MHPNTSQYESLSSRIQIPDYQTEGPYSEKFRTIETKDFLTSAERADTLNIKQRAWEVFMRSELDNAAVSNIELSNALNKAQSDYYKQMTGGSDTLAQTIQIYTKSRERNNEYDYAVIRESQMLRARIPFSKRSEGNMIHSQYLEMLQEIALKYGLSDLPLRALNHTQEIEKKYLDLQKRGGIFLGGKERQENYDVMGIFITNPNKAKKTGLNTEYLNFDTATRFTSRKGFDSARTQSIKEDYEEAKVWARQKQEEARERMRQSRVERERARQTSEKTRAEGSSQQQTQQETSGDSYYQNTGETGSGQRQRTQESRVPQEDLTRYYQVLGVQPGATQAEIKTAYRKMARENHPDVVGENAQSNEKIRDINNAMDALKAAKVA